MKKEYIIIGSDNFWYASCLNSLKEAKKEVGVILDNISAYGNPEAMGDRQEDLPEKLYIYKAYLVKESETNAY